MKESRELPEDASDSAFIAQVMDVFLVVAYPFLPVLLGSAFGNLAAITIVVGATRYCRSLRKKAEERTPVSEIAFQAYVVHLLKRFIAARIGAVALIAPFLKHPFGLIYFLVITCLSVGDLFWQSAKLGDMRDKESNQVPEPTPTSRGASS